MKRKEDSEEAQAPWSASEPYYVHREHTGCSICEHGASFVVVFGPDDTVGSTSYDDEEMALEECNNKNAAYKKGQQSKFLMTREQAKLIVDDIEVKGYLEEADRQIHVLSEPTKQAYRALLAYAEGVEGP